MFLHDPDMDIVGMVVIAISALALLEVAAANLRGEERSRRSRRFTRSR
jgi:Tfp pilus assembly protein PilV